VTETACRQRITAAGTGQHSWEQLADEAERAMLQRFVRERTEDAFGIYM
jgi:hypothetical protein